MNVEREQVSNGSKKIKNTKNMKKYSKNGQIEGCPKKEKDCANCDITNCPEEKT